MIVARINNVHVTMSYVMAIHEWKKSFMFRALSDRYFANGSVQQRAAAIFIVTIYLNLTILICYWYCIAYIDDVFEHNARSLRYYHLFLVERHSNKKATQNKLRSFLNRDDLESIEEAAIRARRDLLSLDLQQSQDFFQAYCALNAQIQKSAASTPGTFYLACNNIGYFET